MKAVIAESYERIHRSNLVGMGILPLQYLQGQNAETLGLTGKEIFNIPISDKILAKQKIEVTVHVYPIRNSLFSKQAFYDMYVHT